jgi:hypothetical protein
LGGQAGLVKSPKEPVFRPILLQKLEHHFATLGKGLFHDGAKAVPEILRQKRFGAAIQHDASGVNVRLREEAACGDFE